MAAMFPAPTTPSRTLSITFILSPRRAAYASVPKAPPSRAAPIRLSS